MSLQGTAGHHLRHGISEQGAFPETACSEDNLLEHYLPISFPWRSPSLLKRLQNLLDFALYYCENSYKNCSFRIPKIREGLPLLAKRKMEEDVLQLFWIRMTLYLCWKQQDIQANYNSSEA